MSDGETETLLRLDIPGWGNITLSLIDWDEDPVVGSVWLINGIQFRVVSAAQLELCQDGKPYWVIRAQEIGHCYH
jgi:hypothetical protein